MNPVAFLVSYIIWHYSSALVDILRTWGNFIWFVLHFFSTGTLLKTFFTPFNRLTEDYPKRGHFDPGYYAGTILVNLIMRIVGVVVRSVFIIGSLLGTSIIIIVGLGFIAFWLIAPLGVVVLLFTGLGFAFP